jgi:hypothetical protein
MRDVLPFGVGGGLVAIKTLLSRDPCVHANTAIEMIDAILKEHPAAPVQEPVASLSELQKDAANLLFALHDAWPYVHGQCTIESKRKAIQALIVKHGEFADLHPPAQPAVPDAMTSADIQESIEYVAGWNECRQAMMEMMK